MVKWECEDRAPLRTYFDVSPCSVRYGLSEARNGIKDSPWCGMDYITLIWRKMKLCFMSWHFHGLPEIGNGTRLFLWFLHSSIEYPLWTMSSHHILTQVVGSHLLPNWKSLAPIGSLTEDSAGRETHCLFWGNWGKILTSPQHLAFFSATTCKLIFSIVLPSTYLWSVFLSCVCQELGL